MKLLFPSIAALAMLGSPVHAADSVSFVIAGHRIQIEAPDRCKSASCLSVSIPGVFERRGRRNDGEREVATSSTAPASTTTSSAAPASTRPAAAVCAPPSSAPKPIAAQPLAVSQPYQRPHIQPVQSTPVAPVKTAAIVPSSAPALPPSPEPPLEIVRPAKIATPVLEDTLEITEVSTAQVSSTKASTTKALHEVEDEPADSPLGDWQAAGQKGIVRIEPCGQALCGTTVDASSNTTGETVLIDMKSKTATQWSGNIYSHDSGNTYYGTMTLKGPDSLRVEACAIGHFVCSGNLWRRVDIKPRPMVSDRGTTQQPRS